MSLESSEGRVAEVAQLDGVEITPSPTSPAGEVMVQYPCSCHYLVTPTEDVPGSCPYEGIKGVCDGVETEQETTPRTGAIWNTVVTGRPSAESDIEIGFMRGGEVADRFPASGGRGR